MNIHTPHPSWCHPNYLRSCTSWPLVEALWSRDTAALRSSQYCPRHEKEHKAVYKARIEAARLDPFFEDAVKDMGSRPFSRPVQLIALADEDENVTLPEELERMQQDADGLGASLTCVTESVFTDGELYGVGFFLVLGPKQSHSTEAARRTAGDDPRIRAVSPRHVINWKTDLQTGEVTEVLIIEDVVRDGDHDYAQLRHMTREADLVLLLRMDHAVTASQSIHTIDSILAAATPQSEDGEPSRYPPALQGMLPLHPYYRQRAGQFLGTSPHRALAEMNLAHFQLLGEQTLAVRMRQATILNFAGWDSKSAEREFALASAQFFCNEDTEAKIEATVMPTGGVEAARVELNSLEERMLQRSQQDLQETVAGETAHAAGIREAKLTSPIKKAVGELEQVLTHALRMAALWLPQRADVGDFMRSATADIFTEFRGATADSSDIDTLLGLFDRGLLCERTLLQEIARRGVLSEGIDCDEELDQAREDSARRGGPLDLDDLEDPTSVEEEI